MASHHSDNVVPDPFSNLLPHKEHKLHLPHVHTGPIVKAVNKFTGKFCVRTSIGEYIPLVPSVEVPPLLGLPRIMTIEQVQAQDWNIVEGEYDPDSPPGYTLEPVPSYHSSYETSPEINPPSSPKTPPRQKKLTHATGTTKDALDKARETWRSRKEIDFQQAVDDSSDQKTDQKIEHKIGQHMDQKMDQKKDHQVDQKMDQKMDQQMDQKKDQKMEQKTDQNIKRPAMADQKIDPKIKRPTMADQKIDQKMRRPTMADAHRRSPGPTPPPRPEDSEVVESPEPEKPYPLDGATLDLLMKYEGFVGVPPWDKPDNFEPLTSLKQYCTYWMRLGECDYFQRTCKFQHFIPPTWAWLKAVGFHTLPKWFEDREPKSAVAMFEILGPRPKDPENDAARIQLKKMHLQEGGPRRDITSYAAPKQLQQYYQTLRDPAMASHNARPSHKKPPFKAPQYDPWTDSTDPESDFSLMSSKYAPGMPSGHKGPKRGHIARRDGPIDTHQIHVRPDRLERPKHSRYDNDAFVGVNDDELDPGDSRSEISSLMRFSDTRPSHGRKGSRNTPSVASSRPPYMPEPLRPMQAQKHRWQSVPAAVPAYTPARMPTPNHPDMFTDRKALRNASSVAEVEAKNDAVSRAMYHRSQKGLPTLTGPQRIHREVQSNVALNQRLAALTDTDRDLQPSGSSATSMSGNVPVQTKAGNGTGGGRKRGKKPGQKNNGNGQGPRGESPGTPPPAGHNTAGAGGGSSSNGSAALDGRPITRASEQKMKPIGAERLGA